MTMFPTIITRFIITAITQFTQSLIAQFNRLFNRDRFTPAQRDEILSIHLSVIEYCTPEQFALTLPAITFALENGSPRTFVRLLEQETRRMLLENPWLLDSFVAVSNANTQAMLDAQNGIDLQFAQLADSRMARAEAAMDSLLARDLTRTAAAARTVYSGCRTWEDDQMSNVSVAEPLEPPMGDAPPPYSDDFFPPSYTGAAHVEPPQYYMSQLDLLDLGERFRVPRPTLHVRKDDGRRTHYAADPENWETLLNEMDYSDALFDETASISGHFGTAGGEDFSSEMRMSASPQNSHPSNNYE